MYANGIVILLMVAANISIFQTVLNSTASPGAQIVGALMRNSSALILWMIGPLCGFIAIAAPCFRLRITSLQMGYLNMFSSVTFLIVIVHHGFSASNSAYILSSPGGLQDHIADYLHSLTIADDMENAISTAVVSEKITSVSSVVAIQSVVLSSSSIDYIALFLISRSISYIFWLIIPTCMCIVICFYAFRYSKYCEEVAFRWAELRDEGLSAYQSLIAYRHSPRGKSIRVP